MWSIESIVANRAQVGSCSTISRNNGGTATSPAEDIKVFRFVCTSYVDQVYLIDMVLMCTQSLISVRFRELEIEYDCWLAVRCSTVVSSWKLKLYSHRNEIFFDTADRSQKRGEAFVQPTINCSALVLRSLNHLRLFMSSSLIHTEFHRYCYKICTIIQFSFEVHKVLSTVLSLVVKNSIAQQLCLQSISDSFKATLY